MDQNYYELNILETENKNIQITLPKRPYAVFALEGFRAAVSYGPWGELAIVDLKRGVAKNHSKLQIPHRKYARRGTGE